MELEKIWWADQIDWRLQALCEYCYCYCSIYIHIYIYSSSKTVEGNILGMLKEEIFTSVGNEMPIERALDWTVWTVECEICLVCGL